MRHALDEFAENFTSLRKRHSKRHEKQIYRLTKHQTVDRLGIQNCLTRKISTKKRSNLEWVWRWDYFVSNFSPPKKEFSQQFFLFFRSSVNFKCFLCRSLCREICGLRSVGFTSQVGKTYAREIDFSGLAGKTSIFAEKESVTAPPASTHISKKTAPTDPTANEFLDAKHLKFAARSANSPSFPQKAST